MGKIRELPKSSSYLLTSSQIITSVYCVVKELIENALDSSSTNVEVKLEDYGLEKIEVKDNGCGIDKDDIPYVVKPHFTSKLSSYSDLEKINTYGFRGEALSAICAVADLIIITKTSGESIGHLVNYNHNSEVTSSKPFPCPQGTTVSVKNLFKNIPVRRQYYRSEKNKKDDLHKVEDLLMAFGCIQNDVRFALHHNKNLIWQKPSLPSTKSALIHVLGNSICDHLQYIEYVDEKTQVKMECFLPKLGAPINCSLTSPNKCIIVINHRPVRIKAVDKLLKEFYNASIQNTGKSRYPICYISFTVLPSEVDVNIEPNKTAVVLLHSEEFLSQFARIMKDFYCTNISENNIVPEVSAPNQDPKSSPTDFLNSLKVTCDTKIQKAKLTSVVDNSASINHSVDKEANIINSFEKLNKSMNKKDINIISTPNEPKKKKIKSILSKNDIESHINTLKNFFPSEKNNLIENTNVNLNSEGEMTTVTVERMDSNQNAFLSEANNDRQKNDHEITFAVSKDLYNCNSISNENHVTNRKRHFSNFTVIDEKSIEENLKRPILDLNEQNGNAWSRGILPCGDFQPVKVLQPKAINVPEPPKDIVENVKKKEVTEVKSPSFERKLTPFDIFCRNHRLEIAAKNPDLTNQQIAQILTEKWNCLSTEEKAVFKNMLDKNYPQHVKKKEKLGRIVSQNLNQEKSTSLVKASKKKMKPKVKEKNISFELENVKSFYLENVKLLSEDLNLINYLAPGIWICGKDRKLLVLNTFRLQETIIYHRLLETLHFEIKPVDIPQNINASHVDEGGIEILHQLCNLETESGNISDEKIIANGFDIKFVREKNNKTSFQLIGITSNIAFYGVPDLKELLQLIKSKGPSAKLSECRPGKIMLYLQSEANRISRQTPACQRVQDVDDLLRQRKCLLVNCNECIHSKPFFNELYKY